jgi:hypothetical protein
MAGGADGADVRVGYQPTSRSGSPNDCCVASAEASGPDWATVADPYRMATALDSGPTS